MPSVIPFTKPTSGHVAVAVGVSKQPAPLVLTASFRERMAILNAAARELRRLGFHIVWSGVSGPVPQAHIRRDVSVSVAPLLDRMGPRSFRTEDGCTVVSGKFEGIILSWAEPN